MTKDETDKNKKDGKPISEIKAPQVMSVIIEDAETSFIDAARMIHSDEIPKSFSSEIISKTIDNEYKYARLGLFIGLIVTICGILLGLYGAVSYASWSAKFVGFESSLIDASPGVILSVIGLFIVFFTRPKVKLKNLKG